MNKYLFIFFFFACNLIWSQHKVDKLQDSLNTTLDVEKRIDLRKQIALDLMFEDWDKA